MHSAKKQLDNNRSRTRALQRKLESKGAESGRFPNQWQPAAEDQEMWEPQEAAEVVEPEPKARPRNFMKIIAQRQEKAEPKAMPKQKAMARAGKKDPEHAEDSDCYEQQDPEHAEDSDSSSTTHEKGTPAHYWQQKGREDKRRREAEDKRMRAREAIQRKAIEDMRNKPPPWRVVAPALSREAPAATVVARGSVAAVLARPGQSSSSSSSKGEGKNKLLRVGCLPGKRPRP